MDPNACLAEIRRIVRKYPEGFDASTNAEQDDANSLLELAAALDAWLTSGGAKPAAWPESPGAHYVWGFLAGAASGTRSGPFDTKASAERFAAGLASSGRVASVTINGGEKP